ncbi:GNAT family N-acetyltransferase [Thiohalocapsa sp. ML1]|jgi:GNAT superfamily N-acetyltransferase|uniref:GNAT family N-acetyltransferase n=1 Tax=Thiohalocapsa sp. ML1 TaxID=1431688 RepID=UPI000732180E|nr:GNAT family N-acetyltransferase [Thiohalocapsa sp. ML1]
MPDFVIRALARADERGDFTSGDIDLDRFFRRFAGQNQFRHHIGTSYVAVGDGRILGFATISAGEITGATLSQSLRKRLPDYPLPILRIARLAVDHRAQRRGVGRALLRFTLRLGLDLRERCGCVGVLVDAKPAAVPFCDQLGFIRLTAVQGQLGDRPEPQPMFLPIRLVEAGVGD